MVNLAGTPINPKKETEGIITCKVIELWQSIQNDTNQRQVEGSNFDLHLWFNTTRVQVVRTQQAVDGTDSFPPGRVKPSTEAAMAPLESSRHLVVNGDFYSIISNTSSFAYCRVYK